MGTRSRTAPAKEHFLAAIKFRSLCTPLAHLVQQRPPLEGTPVSV